MIELPKVMRVSPLDFLDTVDENKTEVFDGIDIKFTSDLKDMTFAHYITQPRSMLCRKLEKNLLKKTLEILITIGFQIVLDI